VGLKTSAQAAAAAKYFHKSFMDTCRLEIEFAESFMDRGSAATRRPWSKHSLGSSAHAAAHGVAKGWKDAPAADAAADAEVRAPLSTTPRHPCSPSERRAVLRSAAHACNCMRTSSPNKLFTQLLHPALSSTPTPQTQVHFSSHSDSSGGEGRRRCRG